jgi:hypothetical protein
VKAVTFAVVFVVCLASGTHAATLHVDGFDEGVEGWVTGGAQVTYRATGGMGGGGFVELSSFNHMAAFNVADRWVGSFASIGANEIRADLMAPPTAPPLEMRIVLFGAGEPRTADRWTSAAP